MMFHVLWSNMMRQADRVLTYLAINNFIKMKRLGYYEVDVHKIATYIIV